MIKFFTGLVVFTLVLTPLLSFIIEPLLNAKGQFYYWVGPYLVYESMFAFNAILSFVLFYYLYKLFVH